MDRGSSVKDKATTPEATFEKYLGQWGRLVSTTNWEKGRILCEWRNELIESGAKAKLYSDEAWSRRVGNVTAQHVGRLRRVYERFGETSPTYEGLYWSHFQAAMEWDDAEMWLEGAVQSKWSVSQMRRKRWETLGDPNEPEPSDDDIVTADLDEDAPATVADNSPRSTAEEKDSARGKRSTSEDENEEEADPSATTISDEHVAAVRPFEELPEMPEDVADAFESFKLAILRHKLASWDEIARDDVIGVLDALRQLALAP